MAKFGFIVVLNGVPRSGKSSIVRELQKDSQTPWLNLGVDNFKEAITPKHFSPGLGLRPGAHRPDLETYVPAFFAALYDSVAAHSRSGLNVVVDIGHHEAYSKKLNILKDSALRIQNLPALFVGVRCSLEEVMNRRNQVQTGREGAYATSSSAGQIPESVYVWEKEVHSPGIYDIEVDTSKYSPDECARIILGRLNDHAPFIAFQKIADQTS